MPAHAADSALGLLHRLAVLAVVVPAGGDPDLLVHQLVHEAVLISDAPGPVAGEVVLQRLRLTDALIAVALDVRQQQVDPLEDSAVLGLPPQVVLPRVLVPDEEHVSRRRSRRVARRDRPRGAPWHPTAVARWPASASGTPSRAATRSLRERR